MRLRFPGLSVLAVFAFILVPELRERNTADVGMILFSHGLLVRTRFFEGGSSGWQGPIAASASGWLTAISLLSVLLFDDPGHKGWLAPVASLAIAIGFGAVGLIDARRNARLDPSPLDPKRPSSLVAFMAGFGALVGMYLVCFVVAILTTPPIAGGFGNSVFIEVDGGSLPFPKDFAPQ